MSFISLVDQAVCIIYGLKRAFTVRSFFFFLWRYMKFAVRLSSLIKHAYLFINNKRQG